MFPVVFFNGEKILV